MEIYDHNYLPASVDVDCPKCGKAARFVLAECVLLRDNLEIDAFRNAEGFEYVRERDERGTIRHIAIRYLELVPGEGGALPDIVTPEDWEKRSAPSRLIWDGRAHLGTLVCNACGRRTRHELDWPAEARFKIDYRGKVLWAFTREHANELIDYVAAPDRDRGRFKFQAFLRNIPKEFLVAKAREEVVRRLRRAVSEGA